MSYCPADNKNETDPTRFWDNGPHFDTHRIGWAVAGLCALVATLISFYLITKHCQYYHKANQQRYIIRIILLIPIYSIISWLSYRFFHYSVYFETVRDFYEAFVIFAFFALLTQYVGDHMTEEKRKDIFYMNKNDDNNHNIQFINMKYPFPCNCVTYNPTSHSHLLFVKWGILQYVVVNPIVTFIALLTNALGVYCEGRLSFKFAKVYCSLIGFVSIAIAMYALITFYLTIKDAIKEEAPFYKFLCIKLVIFLTIIQNIIFSILSEAGVIEETEYWTSANISRGLNALLICFEMLIFAILYLYAFDYRKYQDIGDKFGKKMGDEKRKHIRTPISKGILDAFNPKDIYNEFKFVCKYIWYLISGKKLPDSTSKALNIYAAIHSHDQRTYNPLIINNYEEDYEREEKEMHKWEV
ncbi:hypothetical protein Glove_13g222 [Diversispora epigaea]|uniref:Organic solute transporter Ostalpha-domain-containing protein n=1 Tax=Diversispora epigaea TaxID=1348612 RepID=A0A397JNU2_9GLOM|nr:hypothetical protein Glove_13g222 [Diversispora epigaea]